MAKKTRRISHRKPRHTKHAARRAVSRRKRSPRKAGNPGYALTFVDRIKETIFGAFDTRPVAKSTLLDFLSEFLAVEKGGIELYTAAWERSTDLEIKDTYAQFLEQTRNHKELLIRAIEDMGEDPTYESPGARVQTARAKAMIELEVPSELRELADAENLLLAETKDHMDWSFLKEICPRIQDTYARAAVEAIVDHVESEEDRHLKFARQAVEKLTKKIAFREDAQKEESWAA